MEVTPKVDMLAIKSQRDPGPFEVWSLARKLEAANYKCERLLGLIKTELSDQCTCAEFFISHAQIDPKCFRCEVQPVIDDINKYFKEKENESL